MFGFSKDFFAMKLGIMQPYFLPYVGYFQLLSAVDKFVIYDNIKYTKRGWINRNRMLVSNTDKLFSLSLRKDSNTLDINQRYLSPLYDRVKLLDKFRAAYSKSPNFASVFSLLTTIVSFEEDNLFSYIYNSISKICQFLEIGTDLHISSGVAVDHSLRAEDRVIAICKAFGAKEYINPIGGIELYGHEYFLQEGVRLKFLRSRAREYNQFGSEFVSQLSIIDLLMFEDLEKVRECIDQDFDLILPGLLEPKLY